MVFSFFPEYLCCQHLDSQWVVSSQTTFQTSHGQMLDLITTPPGKVDNIARECPDHDDLHDA